MSYLDKLKQNRESSFEKLKNQLTKMSGNQSNDEEDKYWRPTVDKAGNGYAVIRFMPAPEGEDIPYVRIWDHGFQGPGGWYIQKSLTTINQPDPCSEYNAKLWNTGIEANKEIVRKQKRRLSYTANIYVVSDPAKPENEGKVFLFKFGKKIYSKIAEAMNPEFPDEKPFNPFDIFTGANFALKIRKVEGYQNYDKSEFLSPAPLSGNEAVLENALESLHSVQALISPDKFKSYDELKNLLHRALGLDESRVTIIHGASAEEDSEPEYTPRFKERPAPAREAAPEPKFTSGSDEEDEDLAFFQKFAED